MNEQNRMASEIELDAARAALAALIARWTEKQDRLETRIPGLLLRRYEAPTEPMSYLHEPSICLVAQGTKRICLGEESYQYDANHYLITSVGVPVMGNVIEASPEAPLLGLVYRLDLPMAAQLMADSDLPVPQAPPVDRGMAICPVSTTLLNAFQRMISLLDQPAGIPILLPLIQKEILYYLLTGDQGARLRQIATEGSHGHQIAEAIGWLRGNYSQQLKVEKLARQSGMSVSTFHHHFRTLTTMSPLQFQKWLRLHEARRLMLAEKQDVTRAALSVGYESLSQFSREYKRQFGTPPLRDIKSLQQMGQA